MWFKNLRFYTVDLTDLKHVIKDEALVEEALDKAKFKPCAAQELSSVGFAPIFPKAPQYHFGSGDNHFFKIIEETKLLPSSVVKTELNAVTDAKEIELKRQLRKNEKEALKAAVTGKLLSQAFATRRELLIWFNSSTGVVGIATTSTKRAEKSLALLREAFSSFPAKLLSAKTMVDSKMTSWLKDATTLPQKLALGSETTLKSSDKDGGIIRASKEDLTSEEIGVHLEAGKLATEIGLSYDSAVDFTLTSDIALKKIKPTDIYLERNLPEKTEDEIADMQSLLILQGKIFTALCDYLMEVFSCDRA